MIIKHGRHIFGEIHEARKGLRAFFLDCAFRVLIGWADKLRSHDLEVAGRLTKYIRITKYEGAEKYIRLTSVSLRKWLFWDGTIARWMSLAGQMQWPLNGRAKVVNN